MKVQFAMMDPTGNTTLLVFTPVPRRRHASLAEKLMRELGGEQVGYLETPSRSGARVRLQMMGGEFCGNASMALAAFIAQREGMRDNQAAVYPLEVSGAEGLVCCRVRREGEIYLGTVSMPLPEEISQREILPGLNLPLVKFPGISHLIVPESAIDSEEAQAQLPGLCERLNADAMGMLFTNREKTTLRPLVYVRATKSAVWERGCGSGTAALGACAAAQTGRDAALTIAQPGGCMGVRATWKQGAVREIEITGRVRLECMGEVEI